jgi:hypothetical protein
MSLRSLAILIVASALLRAPAARAQSDDTGTAKPPTTPSTAPTEQPTTTADEQRSEGTAPAIAAPAARAVSATLVNPWFVRPAFSVTAGTAAPWTLTVFGFAEADAMWDSTRSFNDGLNSNVVAHIGTQAGDNPRLQSTIRNSRLGFRIEAPAFDSIRSSALLEFDLFGNQPSINSGGGSPGQPSGTGATTESAYFNNAAFRVRHAYVKLETPIVDLLAGQSYHLLGWQNYFFGSTCAFLGMPNALFNRTVQLRLSHSFASDAVSFDIAAAAVRPIQRDSALPEGEGGLRLAIKQWKGMTTPGSGGTGALPAAIGISGMVRQLKVDPYAPLPAPPIHLVGWALAANILLPIVPVKDSTDRGNALTITGEFVTGTGDADQYTGMTAGATMPNAFPYPPGTQITATGSSQPPPTAAGAQPLFGLPYTPNVDPGLVAFDPHSKLHTINWQTFVVGIQYYLPPTGRVFITGNYSQGKSNNIASLYHPGAITQLWINPRGVFSASWYVDGNLFVDITPAARMGLSYQRVAQTLADGTKAHNDRYEMTWLYFF